jgi:hypothetical protein
MAVPSASWRRPRSYAVEMSSPLALPVPVPVPVGASWPVSVTA